jgi:hypothetical protein
LPGHPRWSDGPSGEITDAPLLEPYEPTPQLPTLREKPAEAEPIEIRRSEVPPNLVRLDVWKRDDSEPGPGAA